MARLAGNPNQVTDWNNFPSETWQAETHNEHHLKNIKKNEGVQDLPYKANRRPQREHRQPASKESIIEHR